MFSQVAFSMFTGVRVHFSACNHLHEQLELLLYLRLLRLASNWASWAAKCHARLDPLTDTRAWPKMTLCCSQSCSVSSLPLLLNIVCISSLSARVSVSPPSLRQPQNMSTGCLSLCHFYNPPRPPVSGFEPYASIISFRSPQKET